MISKVYRELSKTIDSDSDYHWLKLAQEMDIIKRKCVGHFSIDHMYHISVESQYQ